MNAKKLRRRLADLDARVKVLEAVCGADWAQRGVVRLEGHEAVVDGPLYPDLPYALEDDEWQLGHNPYL